MKNIHHIHVYYTIKEGTPLLSMNERHEFFIHTSSVEVDKCFEEILDALHEISSKHISFDAIKNTHIHLSPMNKGILCLDDELVMKIIGPYGFLIHCNGEKNLKATAEHVIYCYKKIRSGRKNH